MFLCKTNPILEMPKNNVTPYPPSTNHDSQASIYAKKQSQNKANSNPINPILAQKQRSKPKNKPNSNPINVNLHNLCNPWLKLMTTTGVEKIADKQRTAAIMAVLRQIQET
jgi:hypothetical protein